jgi:signal transduction histidine kinase
MTEQDKETAASKSHRNTSEPNISEEKTWDNSEEKTRALVADYEARLDEVAQLIARVRHEINNPLTGVLGQAQLLLREELSEKARRRAQTIEELALRLRDIVAELRQVQKPLVRPGNEPRSV